MSTFEIRPAAPLMPDGLTDLASAAAREGIRNVSALVDQWTDGSHRYDNVGEALLVGVDTASTAVMAVGGLTICPHAAGALRVRRFYVDVSWRRRGVARAIATRLIAHGLAHTETLTCNARASAAAPPFWESLGFDPVDAAGYTHRLTT